MDPELFDQLRRARGGDLDAFCYVVTAHRRAALAAARAVLGDAHVGHAGSFTWSGDVHGVHEDGKVVVVRSLSADGAGLAKIVELSAGSDVSVYECPEGDTTMRLEKDDSGPYFCPKHGGELVERDITDIHRNIRVLVDTHEVD